MEIYNGVYSIYCHTSPSGKKYIGQAKDIKKRWLVNGNGKQYKNCKVFYSAIKKYGWENFEHEIIASNLTKKEADNFEKLLIEKLDTQNREKGYNRADGGSGGNHKEIFSVEQYDLQGNYIQTYKSAEEAAWAIFGKRNSGIIACCKGKQLSAGGYQWKYTNNGESKDSYRRKDAKYIEEYDLFGNKINQYESIYKTMEATNISRNAILYSCNLLQEDGTIEINWKMKRIFIYEGQKIKRIIIKNAVLQYKGEKIEKIFQTPQEAVKNTELSFSQIKYLNQRKAPLKIGDYCYKRGNYEIIK